MKKILVPIDFSEAAMNAFRYALKIAENLNWEMEVLHVYKYPLVDPYMPVHILDSLSKEQQKKATADFVDYVQNLAKEDHKLLEKISMNYRLQMGFGTEEILEIAKEIRADMIIMGTTGASGIKAMFLGSVAGEVIEKAKCPVLAIPKLAKFDGSIKKIAFPTDFEQKNHKALDYLEELANQLEAEINCFHIDLSNTEQYNHKMQQFAKQHNTYKKTNFEVIEGNDLLEGMEKYAKEKEADVLAMVTHKRNFFKKFFSSSHAKQLSYKSTLPILGIQAHLFS